MQNDNLTETQESHERLLNMVSKSILDSGGFNDDAEAIELPQDSKYLSPSQIQTRDYAKNEVQIPLAILKSKGFDRQRESNTVESLLCGCYSLLMRVVLTASIGSFLFGLNIALLNTCLNVISLDLHWCDISEGTSCNRAILYKAFTSTAVFVGGAIGSTIGGRLSYIGRRMALLLIMVVLSVGIMNSVVASSLASLIWARIIVGFGIGVISVIVPLYISEMAPPASRGFYGAFHQLFLTFGIFIAVILGLPINLHGVTSAADLTKFHRIWWRVMLASGFIPVALCSYLLIYSMNFETPHYYIENNHPLEAKKILQILYNKNNVDIEITAIIRANKEKHSKCVDMTLRKALVTPIYRRVLLIGCALAALQQFTGISVFIASSNEIFKGNSFSEWQITIASTVLLGVNFLYTIPSIFIIDILGRRLLMLIGTMGMFLSIVPAAFYLWIQPGTQLAGYISVLGSVLFIMFFSATYGPVLWVYLFEIYPLNIKGKATGVATACNWLAGIFTVFIAQFVQVKVNFLIFCVMSLFTFVFVYLCMKETKGRLLEDSPYWD